MMPVIGEHHAMNAMAVLMAGIKRRVTGKSR